jgi:myo-inositol-1-phosphate synthase
MSEAREIREPDGKLGVLMPGMGAVATTFVAGVELIKKGLAGPVGSLAQLGTIRLGKRTENRVPKIKGLCPAGRNGRPGLRRLGRLPRRCL